MTKHLYFLALLLLTPFVATAQDNQISGEWTLHANVSTANITNVVDAGSKVYSLISKRITSVGRYCDGMAGCPKKVLKVESMLTINEAESPLCIMAMPEKMSPA